MSINTKFNLHDKVWTIDNNRIICFEVKCIQVIESCFSDSHVRSIVYSGEHTETVHKEEECFNTKDELIDSIQ